VPAVTGRPPYDPRDLLKLYLYEVTTKDSMIQLRPAACQALSTTSSAGFLYVLAETARSPPHGAPIDDEPSLADYGPDDKELPSPSANSLVAKHGAVVARYLIKLRRSPRRPNAGKPMYYLFFDCLRSAEKASKLK
jgi:hypothetical protein